MTNKLTLPAGVQIECMPQLLRDIADFIEQKPKGFRCADTVVFDVSTPLALEPIEGDKPIPEWPMLLDSKYIDCHVHLPNWWPECVATEATP